MPTRYGRLLGWLIVVALTVLALRYYGNPRHRYSGEAFLAFYCAGVATDQHADPYALEPLRACEHFNDPAFAVPKGFVEPAPLPPYDLAAFGLLGRLSYHRAEVVWYALSLAALFGAAFALARVTGWPALITFAGIAVLGFVNLFFGENVPFALVAIALAGLFLRQGRFVAAGIAGAATLSEPHLGVAVVLAMFAFAPKSRAALVVCGLVLGGFAVAALGVHGVIEYLTQTLPSHARAEVAAIDQYSFTWLLHVLRVHDSLALALGSASYVLMLVAGIFVAGRLARQLQAPEMLAFAPVAFVLVGGTFIHDVQLVCAAPFAFALAARSRRPLVAWTSIVLLSVPSFAWWGSWRFAVAAAICAAVVALFALAPFRVRVAVPCAAGVACAILFYVLAARHLHHPRPESVSASYIAVSGESASQNWGRYITESVPAHGIPVRAIASKLPGWTALLALVGLSLWTIAPIPAVRRDTMSLERSRVGPRAAKEQLGWLDAMKGVALLWIVLNHLTERIFGDEFFANPARHWPPLAQRVAQLAPERGHGALDSVFTAVRDVGWLGDQGVGLFLVLSGFGLAYGLRVSGGLPPLLDFYRRRFARIYPTWWGAHAIFIVSALVLGWGLDPFNPKTILSLAGLRFLPKMFYYFSAPWWYVGTILQLYLIFPLLYRASVRRSATNMLLWACALGFVARAVGLYTFGPFVDEWSRGALFVTRLPEFAFGIALACWWTGDRARVDTRLRAPATLVAGALLCLCANALSFTLAGMTLAPFLLAVADFVLLYAALEWIRTRAGGVQRTLRFVGRHSYGAYLMHEPVLQLSFPLGVSSAAAIAFGVASVGAGTVALTALLENLVAKVESWRRALAVLGRLRAAAVVAATLLFAYGLCVAADATVTRLWPQEVEGWGERPSLQASSEFGWQLRPSATTRLRWQTYDYTVTANALGFPGPQFPLRKPPGTVRILTVGDAYTSAEGLDTPLSWPRLAQPLLEAKLDRPVQVLNFAITGYGPEQYDAVVRAFAKRYDVDVVLVQLFAKDYNDVLLSNAEFQRSIGVDRRHFSWLTRLSLAQLQAFTKLNVADRLGDVFGYPSGEGYGLGNFEYLERQTNAAYWSRGVGLVHTRLADLVTAARAGGASVAFLYVPVPVLVCDREELAYYPRSLDVSDTQRFDAERPARVTASLAASLGVPFLNLHAALKAAGRCPYQPKNMHLTAQGEQVVARAVSAWLPVDRKHVATTRRP